MMSTSTHTMPHADPVPQATTRPSVARRSLIDDVLAGCTRVQRRFDDEALEALADADQKARAPKGGVARQCTTKVAYGRQRARRQARVLRENQGEDVHAYSCGNCGQWHVGHRPLARV